MAKNTVSMKVGSKVYNVKGEESMDYLFTVGNYVDKMIGDLQKRAPFLSTEEAAVLASLNIADELFKIKRLAGEWDAESQYALDKTKF